MLLAEVVDIAILENLRKTPAPLLHFYAIVRESFVTGNQIVNRVFQHQSQSLSQFSWLLVALLNVTAGKNQKVHGHDSLSLQQNSSLQ